MTHVAEPAIDRSAPATAHQRDFAAPQPREHAERAPEPRLPEVAQKFHELMQTLGLDPNDPNLRGTEWRVARAYREIFAGWYAGAEPALRAFPNTERYSEPVSVLDIPFYSLCAHHFLPFLGSAHVAYLPQERLVGLSKLARVVEFYARRPQVQERMTEQIVEFLQRRLRPAGVMVVIQARHFCMEMRGIGKPGLMTTTTASRGAFREEQLRREFLARVPRRRAAGPRPVLAQDRQRGDGCDPAAVPTPGRIRRIGDY